MDTLSKQDRSRLMGKVRGRGNKATELVMVKLLRRNRLNGWRRNQMLPGKPDFEFRRERVAVFVDGCYWHGCAQHCRMPTSNRSYWLSKIARNRARDRKVNCTLRAAGWRVLRIWEHELARKREAQLLAKLRKALLA
jgi:DNA mismatch endonuclease (patch repair protein)